jgi:hypothetical protein
MLADLVAKGGWAEASERAAIVLVDLPPILPMSLTACRTNLIIRGLLARWVPVCTVPNIRPIRYLARYRISRMNIWSGQIPNLLYC